MNSRKQAEPALDKYIKDMLRLQGITEYDQSAVRALSEFLYGYCRTLTYQTHRNMLHRHASQTTPQEQVFTPEMVQFAIYRLQTLLYADVGALPAVGVPQMPPQLPQARNTGTKVPRPDMSDATISTMRPTFDYLPKKRDNTQAQ
ncbi:hypothetical protein J8273_7350 [Carpediemonas membranifera]|uniref:Uncharacterized protein n=1 Tax=Carpediemonas membranifera TaxID=201153 RepID=A0A8J6DZY9_9EUKA|nr:hypothetical protein J8273_7350 [Carpediemonas membranifera]|eukprot:KAG9391076.1 hypothetical protein J8273_7350 [Carpediemonas membranifera]